MSWSVTCRIPWQKPKDRHAAASQEMCSHVDLLEFLILLNVIDLPGADSWFFAKLKISTNNKKTDQNT